MKLKIKFISGFLGIASLMAFLGVVNLNSQNNVTKQFNEVTQEVIPELIALEQIKMLSLRMMSKTYSYALIQSESRHPNQININQHLVAKNKGDEENAQEAWDEFEEARGSLAKILAQLQLNTKDPDIQIIAEQMSIVYRDLSKICSQIIQFKQQGIFGEDVISKRKQLEVLEEKFIEEIDHAISFELKKLELENNKANEIAKTSQLVNLTAVVTVITISLTLGLILAERITTPIILLKEAAFKIGQGKFDTKVDIKTEDELIILAESFNKMADQLEETTVSRSYLDNIIRTLSDALIVFNKEMRVKGLNTATISISGYQTNELL
ncbi:MAG: HAMP domain-containing protein [Symploca sp. SIO2E9]|nr:HAMP domain-containing protein [Symploca sp. SIO2E9]